MTGRGRASNIATILVGLPFGVNCLGWLACVGATGRSTLQWMKHATDAVPTKNPFPLDGGRLGWG